MAAKITHDDIDYEVWAEKREAGYSGHWRCLRCNVTGALENCCKSGPEAIGRASARSFTDHHVPNHGRLG